MKQFFLIFALLPTAASAASQTPSALAGCYRIEFIPSQPWLKFLGRDVDLEPSTSVRLYADTHPHFVEGSGIFRSVPLTGSPPDADEYLWTVSGDNLSLRLGGDGGGISVSVKIYPRSDAFLGTAVPFIDMGPTEYQTVQARVARFECRAMGANNSFKPNPLRGST